MRRALTTSLLATLIVAACCAIRGLLAQDQPETLGALPIKDLPDDQLATGLVEGHAIALPAPPEFLLVLAKEGAPKWRKLYHPALQGPESNRAKVALRFGLGLAEGHLATMARDAQRIRDVTTDLQRHAKILGIADGIAESSRTINALAESKAWPSVGFELEALSTRASGILEAQRDADLAHLVTTGLWARLLHISSGIVTEKDFADTTVAVASHWTLAQIAAPFSAAKDPTVTSVRDQIAKLERLWHPDKLASGHEFDDALIEDTHRRMANVVGTFTR